MCDCERHHSGIRCGGLGCFCHPKVDLNVGDRVNILGHPFVVKRLTLAYGQPAEVYLVALETMIRE